MPTKLNAFNLGHWVFNPIDKNDLDINFTELPYGFIYRITNNIDQRMYIGKKQIYTNRKLKPLKGKRRIRRVIKETDWRTYVSSSKALVADIDQHGKDNFLFEIIKWCNSKWELAYFEAELQFQLKVLLDERYYNGIINLRIGKCPHAKSTIETKSLQHRSQVDE